MNVDFVLAIMNMKIMFNYYYRQQVLKELDPGSVVIMDKAIDLCGGESYLI